MRTIRTLLILLSVGLILSSYGQNYTLKVLANKGNNEVRKANGEWERLKTGASLVNTDLLKVSKDAYIGFLHFSGAALEWKKEGTFPISEIVSSINTTSSLVSKYADYLAQKKQEGEHGGNVVGGVHRGGTEAIFLVSPVNAMVMNEKVGINWETEEEDGSYKIIIKDLYGNVLYEPEISGNRYDIDFSNSAFGKEKMFLVQVVSTGEEKAESQEVALVKLEDKQEKTLTKIYKELSGGIDENSALGQYIMAGFYEESKLMLDALNSYRKAMEMEPSVELYEEAYDNFLLRNQLKKNN